ncbi:PIN domain-containing protein [Helicobacter sp. 16-1353]|uniref:PIN domain-containing protein n=1 Tax=Helicobacter sp. 16-1353 TaxID=2004996 RepID=UPI001C661461|nr:PIN domain-containing protein [Helicobacter sp. 16-1353]
MINGAINSNTGSSTSLIPFEYYAKDWKIFIDTCSILHFASDRFWINIIPFLQQYQNKLIIPFKIIEELQKHEANKAKPELAKRAKRCLKDLQQRINDDNFIDIRGEENDSFADNVFQVVFTKFRMTYKLLLITQDNNLARDILALNNNKSVKANCIHVRQINEYGFLSKFINVTHIPKENEIVYSKLGQIKLESKVASGGEGIIYSTDTPYVAKIYKKENIDEKKYEKIKLMLSKEMKCKGVCCPVAELWNSKNEFVGFIMPKAKGKEIQKSIFIKKLFLKNFPDWKKRDTVELCITILKKIKYLHDKKNHNRRYKSTKYFSGIAKESLFCRYG